MINKKIVQLNKPMIGMVHLESLPGSVYSGRPFKMVVERAVDEAKVLVDAGFDALIFQNTGDVPCSHGGDEATVAFMTAVGLKIKEVCPIPMGVNVLMNGSKTALAIASAVGADFVRIKIAVGSVVTSTGIISADPHDYLAFRKNIAAEEVSIFADVYDRTSAPLGDMPLEVLADLAIRHGGANGLVVSGYSFSDTLDRLILLRRALPTAYLVVGGGANVNNLKNLLEYADAVIVGSSIKTGGHFLNPLDPDRAKQFMDCARQLR